MNTSEFYNICSLLFSKWPDKLNTICTDAIKGGKKIRLHIPFEVAKSLNYYNEHDLLKAGTAIELIHTSSLLLDDLPFMDNGSNRRGRKCIHLEYGIAFTQLAALSMFSEAINIILNIDYDNYLPMTEILGLLPRFIGPNEGLIAGQTYDLIMKKNKVNNWEDYYKMVDGKTSSLFMLAFCLGWILGQGSKDKFNDITKLGRKFGRYFQIKDDINDALHENGYYNNCVSIFNKEISIMKMELCKKGYIEGLIDLNIRSEYLRELVNY